MVYAGQQFLSAREIYKAKFVCQAEVSGSNFEPVPLQVETDVLGAKW